MSAGHLTISCLSYVSKSLLVERDEIVLQRSLHRAYGRLKVWANDFDIHAGQLDGVLDYSKHLKEPTISVLLELASCLLTGLKLNIQDEEVRTQLNNAVIGLGDFEQTWNKSNSEDSQGSVLEEIHDILDSLYELSPALDVVLRGLPTSALFREPEPVSMLSIYERLIRDKFPDTPAYLVLRFASQICRTREKLQPDASEKKNLATAVPAAVAISSGSRIINNIVAVKAGLSHTPMQPLHDSGLGSSNYLQVPSRPPISISDVSSAPSAQEEAPILMRMPPMPDGAGDGFICPICSRGQQPLFRSHQWRY
ncbi:hypothetical protein BDD12DRAFT_204552 [Trichophaea hybrida]|nr:hypothetical protein BDD12DRAFT_204552 [Trichophaea hybrida]